MAMKTHHPQDPDAFLHREARLAWTDFERIRYLRELARNIQVRLEALYQHPYRNAEIIAREQIALAAVEQELQELETRDQIY